MHLVVFCKSRIGFNVVRCPFVRKNCWPSFTLWKYDGFVEQKDRPGVWLTIKCLLSILIDHIVLFNRLWLIKAAAFGAAYRWKRARVICLPNIISCFEFPVGIPKLVCEQFKPFMVYLISIFLAQWGIFYSFFFEPAPELSAHLHSICKGFKTRDCLLYTSPSPRD